RGFDLLTTNDLVDRPVAAFHQNVGQQPRDQREWRFLIKDGHEVNGLQRGNNFGSFLFVEDWAALSLENSHRTVAVQSNDQHIAQGSSVGEVTHVARVKQIETAVCEDYGESVTTQSLALANQLLHGKYFGHECARASITCPIKTEGRGLLLSRRRTLRMTRLNTTPRTNTSAGS